MPTALKISPEELAVYRATARHRWEVEQQELARREERAWDAARRAAALLKGHFDAERVVVFGSLVHKGWLHPLVGCGHCGLRGSSRGYLSGNESSAGGGYGAGGEPGGHGSMPPLVVESHRADKGYFGKVEFDDGANVFHGEVINLRDVLTAKRST